MEENNVTYTINFNQDTGISLSDVVGISARFDQAVTEILVDNFTSNQYMSFDIDIENENEVIFSCRNIIFACIDEDNPRQEELLEFAGTANITRFEYGINEAIPHSKGGELLCPGNNISDGFVIFRSLPQPTLFEIPQAFFIGYIGLNNGNSRGSFDSFWFFDFRVN